MPRQGDVHVVPASDGWVVEVEGQSGRSVFPTEDKAIKLGRILAANNRSELLIHCHWRQDPPVRARVPEGPPRPKLG